MIESRTLNSRWGTRSYENAVVAGAASLSELKYEINSRNLYGAIGVCALIGEGLYDSPKGVNYKECVLGVVSYALDNGSKEEIEALDRDVLRLGKRYAESLFWDEKYLLKWKNPSERRRALGEENRRLRRALSF